MASKIIGTSYKVVVQLDDSGNPGDWDVSEFYSLEQAQECAHTKEAYYKYAWSIRVYRIETVQTEVEW